MQCDILMELPGRIAGLVDDNKPGIRRLFGSQKEPPIDHGPGPLDTRRDSAIARNRGQNGGEFIGVQRRGVLQMLRVDALQIGDRQDRRGDPLPQGYEV